jgi:glucosylceramidase
VFLNVYIKEYPMQYFFIKVFFLALVLTEDLVLAASKPEIRSYLSAAWDKTQRLSDYKSTTGETHRYIQVDKNQRRQQIEGFGAALTDVSARLISDLPASQRASLLRRLFSKRDGIGLNFLRVPLGGSDFTHPESLEHYTYSDKSENLESLSIDHDDAYVIPTLKEIKSLKASEGYELSIMATPWSAPAWMKTSNHLCGGSLVPDKTSLYAEYLRRVVQEFKRPDREIIFDYITLQNEPAHETSSYPTMTLDTNQQKVLAIALGREFESHDVSTRILAWDHNWRNEEHNSFPLDFFSNNRELDRVVSGTAWHGYGGDPSDQGLFYRVNPGKGVYFTEITAFGDFNSVDRFLDLGWSFKNVMKGSTDNGARAVLYWNLVLDDQHGPKLPGGCSNCKGLITLTQSQDFVLEHEYFALGHFSKFVHPGAYSIVSEVEGDEELYSSAFLNTDDSIVVVTYNDRGEDLKYRLEGVGIDSVFVLPAKSALTHVIR